MKSNPKIVASAITAAIALLMCGTALAKQRT